MSAPRMSSPTLGRIGTDRRHGSGPILKGTEGATLGDSLEIFRRLERAGCGVKKLDRRSDSAVRWQADLQSGPPGGSAAPNDVIPNLDESGSWTSRRCGRSRARRKRSTSGPKIELAGEVEREIDEPIGLSPAELAGRFLAFSARFVATSA